MCASTISPSIEKKRTMHILRLGHLQKCLVILFLSRKQDKEGRKKQRRCFSSLSHLLNAWIVPDPRVALGRIASMSRNDHKHSNCSERRCQCVWCIVSEASGKNWSSRGRTLMKAMGQSCWKEWRSFEGWGVRKFARRVGWLLKPWRGNWISCISSTQPAIFLHAC